MREDEDMAVIAYRVRELEHDHERLVGTVVNHGRDLEHIHSELRVHGEQISGEGGLHSAMKMVQREIGSMRTAFYGLTASIIMATLGVIISHAI